MKRFFLATGVVVLFLYYPLSGAAQGVPSADVQVQSITVGKDLKLGITLFSYWDDTAKNVRLHVLLPHGVRAPFLPTYCSSIAMNDGTHGTITCEVGDIQVLQTKLVEIQLQRVYPANRKTVSAFAWSIMPEPLPSNNYLEATLPY